ncbi:hypothetical protein JTB14_025711 [Gonioctena quinquepunctata]|nr:hypothetical protein JTB14_025711 [Gonioctena quinquepunctata]
MHNGEPSKQMTFICPLCERNILWDEFTNHVEIMHEVRLTEENLNFSSLEEFTEWKDIVEAEDLNHYIKVRGDRQTGAGVLQRYFHCHRSGHYQTRGERLRRLKSQGSKKINAYCPANMKVMISPDGTCSVNYLKTHLGHKNDLHHLTLTRSDRKLHAAASATDMKLCSIFSGEELPDSTSDEKAEQLHLVTEKDISNIETVFNLSSVDDAITIDTWVSSLGDSSRVLYYKPLNRISNEHFDLEEDDYLIIMNAAQCEILKKFGKHCICFDRTYETNSNGFELITLTVIDNTRQGFPCAFLTRRRLSQAALFTFFNFIKEHTGISKTEVLMMDNDDSFYNLWVSVMDPPEKRLFCTWHIERAWSKSLSQIHDENKKNETKNILRTLLLIERDKNICDITMYEALDRMSADADTRQFAIYFKENFSHNVEYWAYCQRLDLGLNVNTYLERLHTIIEYIYFDRRNSGRLDTLFFVLMLFIKGELFDRLIVKHRHYMRMINHAKCIKKGHTGSLKLHSANIIEWENRWYVSSTGERTNIVKIGHDLCKCNLKCEDCNSCPHKYVCSCIDNSIEWNMCKHIHLVCRYLQDKKVLSKNSVDTSSVDNNMSFDSHEDSREVESETFSAGKGAVYKEISELVESITSPEELDVIKKCITEMKPMLKALRSSKMSGEVFSSATEGNILQQRLVDSTYFTKNNKNYKYPFCSMLWP